MSDEECLYTIDFETGFGVVAKRDCDTLSEAVRKTWKYCPVCGKLIIWKES